MTAEWWERARAAETVRAQELLRDFVGELRRRGIAPEALRARAGSARYRTDLVGWYLRANGSLAVGTAGEYYVLDVAPSLTGRFRGVVISPSEPPLQVGRGARDGESVELAELLRLRLDELQVSPCGAGRRPRTAEAARSSPARRSR